jgi:hypothetical protein
MAAAASYLLPRLVVHARLRGGAGTSRRRPGGNACRRRINYNSAPFVSGSCERVTISSALTIMVTHDAFRVSLKKYRSGGEQKVTVQHVSVSDNAQAIVGNVSTGGRRDMKKSARGWGKKK